MNETTNLTKFLLDLSNSSLTNKFDVYFDVLGKSHSFRCMTVGQHQKLLETATEKYKGMKEFKKELFSIMKENSLNGSAELFDLSIIDFHKFHVLNRIHSLSKVYQDYEIKSDQFESFGNSFKLENLSIANGIITINCSYPTIKKTIFIESHTKLDENNEGKSLVSLFASELLKYITSISINDNILNLENLSFEERMLVYKQLSPDLILQLSKKITAHNNFIENLYTVKRFSENDSERGNDIKIPLDVEFYGV